MVRAYKEAKKQLSIWCSALFRSTNARRSTANAGSPGLSTVSADGATKSWCIEGRAASEIDPSVASSIGTSRQPMTSNPSSWASFPMAARAAIGKLAQDEGFDVIGWRDVPIDDATLGPTSDAARPSMTQLFVAPSADTVLSPGDPALAVDRLAFVLRKRAEHQIDNCYLASLSARTIIYK